LIFPIKKYDKLLVNRIIAACCLWWILLVFIYPPKGYNYKIYSYNAHLTLTGQKAFDRENVNSSFNQENSYFHDAKYLDYTGAQHLLYVLIEYLNLSHLNSKLYGFGFQIWTIINFSTILLLIFYLNNSLSQEMNAPMVFSIIMITFFPVFPFYMIISSWQDKLIFLLIPLLLLFLIQSKKIKLTSFSIGFTAAFNGLTIFFIPLYLIFLFREVKKDFWLNVMLIFAGIFVALVPFFPESISGWKYRLIRLNSDKPFWFSFYSLFNNSFYSPILNKLIMVFVCLVTILLYKIKKINLVDSLIISISIIIMISPFNDVARVIPIILLVTLLTPNISNYNWLTLILLLFLFFSFDTGYITPIVNNDNTILFYSPVLYSYILYFYKRLKYSNNYILKLNL